MKPLATALLLLAFSAQPAWAEIQGAEITYQAGDTTLKGYLAVNTTKKGPRPGVLVVHEWWGHNDYARKRARMLAGLGYTALAVDMYGEAKPQTTPTTPGNLPVKCVKTCPSPRRVFWPQWNYCRPNPASIQKKSPPSVTALAEVAYFRATFQTAAGI